MSHRLGRAAAILFVLAFAPAGLRADTVPAGMVLQTLASFPAAPTNLAIAPDGRVFVCQQTGALRVVKNGTLLATPFATFTVDSNGERGLLGVAFDPDFTSNGFVYVYYTATTPAIHNRVSRLTASGDVAVGGSEVVLMDIDNLSGATNHNGGSIHFGPDGKLYIAVGENANGANSQTLANRLGKILRINSDGSIPSDNPFFNTASGANRSIWAMGLRNPFTFGFDPNNGTMFINDVGEVTWEEINLGIAGANYGWPSCEGPHGSSTCPSPSAGFTAPIYAYPHSGGTVFGCAIVGSAFYNPNTGHYPASFSGDYLFGDLCQGWLRRFDGGTVTDFATGIGNPVGLAFAPDGDLYYIKRSPSRLMRVSMEQVFGDGFESGNMSAWSTAATDGGNLMVHPAAAMDSTTQGLAAQVVDTNPMYVEDDTPNDEYRYRARFYFDPNGFDPGEGSGGHRTRILIGLAEDPITRLVTLVLKRDLGVYSLLGRVRRDDGTRAETPFATLSDGPHFIEIDWRRASAPGLTDGGFDLRIDGSIVGSLTGLANNTLGIDFVRLGVLSAKSGAGGTMYFDEFDSHRLNLIGP